MGNPGIRVRFTMRARPLVATIALALLLTPGMGLLAPEPYGGARTALAAIMKVRDLGTASSATTSTSLSITTTGPVAAGDSIIVSVALRGAPTGTVTCADTAGNGYSVDADVSNPAAVRTVICSAHNANSLPVGGSILIQHPSAADRAASASEFSGLDPVTPRDQVATSTGTSNASFIVGPTARTSQPAELLVAAFGSFHAVLATGCSPTPPFTALPTKESPIGITTRISPQFNIVSTQGNFLASCTMASPINGTAYAAGLVTYRALVPPTPTPTPTPASTSTATPTATSTRLPGDFNGDGFVDIRDYGVWRQNFGQTNCGNPADGDGNCLVDIRDYGIWRLHFGEGTPADRRGGGPLPAGLAPAPRGTPGPALLASDQRTV